MNLKAHPGMKQAIKKLIGASWQTKLFVFMLVLYMIATVWTTAQAYLRLAYSRSDWPENTINTDS